MLKAQKIDSLSVLVVDDNPGVAESHARIVEEMGHRSIVRTNPEEVEELIDRNPDINFAILDIQMPKLDGLELLRRIKLKKPDMGVVMATVVNDIEKAVFATKRGAYNYLLKPLKPERFKAVFNSYLENHPKSFSDDPRFSIFKTCCPTFKEIFRRIQMFAEADVPVLIEGETGTGKELIAQLIHSVSRRRNDDFIAVNVAALSDQLFESELFGHRKGAFTGALAEHKGYFEEAGQGTLFLDEIGELGMEQQKKLLRVLQSRNFTRLGETQNRTLEACIIFATNRNLREEIEAGQFRDDLYYRLASHVITLPPLRERPGDVELLSRYFFEKYCVQYGRNLEGLGEEALEMLKTYSYPGNVRELEGIISGAVLIEQMDNIQASSLPSYVTYERKTDQSLESSKYREVMRVLAECGGNQTQTAKKLGVARGTLNRWLKEFKEEKKEFNS